MNRFPSKVIWLLFSLLSLVNSFSFEEREAIFNNNDCKVGECEVIELEFSRRQKRSTGSRISFPLKAFGRQRMLNLRPSSGVIIGSNTPVYFAYSNTNIQRGNTQMLSTLFRSQFYEDEENLAAFTLDVDSEGPKIKYGIVRSENLTITPLNPPTNFSESSPRQYYLAKSTFIFTGFPLSQQRTTPVPAQLYPEILLVVDYDLLIIHQNSILQHLINFWNQVNVLFQPLENPRFQLSIAGIVIPVNPQALVFPKTYGIISYDNALVYLSDWLQNARNAIPFNSYDIHMLMTPHNDFNPNVGGSTHMGSACSGLRFGKPLGGVIRDNNDSELSKIINGAHELGHALGLSHDNQIGGEAIPSYLMMSSLNPSQEWSYDSKRKMQQSMQSQDFSCLDNYPQVASSPPNILNPDNNDNGVYNHQPSITNTTPRPYNNNKPNGKDDRVLLGRIDDGDIYSFYPSNIPSGKLVTIVHSDVYSVIGIFYHDPPARKIHNTKGENFFISVPDNQIITLDPSIMSPIRIHVTHYPNYIYAFQSSTYVQNPY